MTLLGGCDYQELPGLIPLTFTDLPGWENADFKDAEKAWEASCRFYMGCKKNPFPDIPLKYWHDLCQHSRNYDLATDTGFRAFLQDHFRVWKVQDGNASTGLFTGYFEPVLKGSRTPSHRYNVPVYQRPPELIVIEELGLFRPALRGHRIAGVVENGTLKPWLTRKEIDKGALANRKLEILWVDDRLNLFWAHIQGSCSIELDDGSRIRLGYDGTNGHAYTAIGKIIQERSGIALSEITMAVLDKWLRDHPDQQDEILWMNESWVFFRELPSQAHGPSGRIGAPLIPMRSLAVDPVYIPPGAPVWLDAEGPNDTPRLQRLFFAHDVGGAIKGRIRGDVFWGSGIMAGQMAGAMKSKGSIYLLLPGAFQFHDTK